MNQMKKFKISSFLLVSLTVLALALIGCGESNTVSSFIISNQRYTERSDLESAKQPEQLTAGRDVYASVYFIESPRGMEYTAKWFVNGNEAKIDMQKMPTDRNGIIVFSLEGNKVIAGTLRFEISYDGDILASKELVIAEE
jgi:hypothetical protein